MSDVTPKPEPVYCEVCGHVVPLPKIEKPAEPPAVIVPEPPPATPSTPENVDANGSPVPQ